MYRITIYGIKPEDIQPVLEKQIGEGGFQVLLRRMKNQYSEQSRELYLDKKDIECLYRYAHQYGSGGFQNKIQILLEKIKMVNEDLTRIIE